MAGERILVVEDERIVARDIEKRLKKLGYTVPFSVGSGEETLKIVAENPLDLILMDIELKGKIDGIETAEQIRTNYNIPIIYLTAYADDITLERAKATEPFGYIVKPFDEKDLHVAIEVALRRRLAEKAIRVALEKEKELSELKSRFWSMVAHEFRTPMTTILGSAQLLEELHLQLPEERRREYLSLIQQSIRSMENLLNDVLCVGRVESGSLKFEPALLDLEQFCRDLIDEMQFNAGSNYQLIFQHQGNCEQICLDKKLLRHILVNLLSNAIKYSPEGGKIYLTISCQEEEVTIQIKDSGIGIPLENQKHLFEPFQRAMNVGTIPGTGLGLTMVKKCLDLHGGEITINSEPGIGTTATVRFVGSVLNRCKIDR
ncbi:response regulator receiver sensor signal transduction histidine kinase [Gloeothece citriformis PCC 7424]|uniref:histidine kinase n=1 Tax=Gloeothece citriformis (strain PCC 7424) TaxID=65393 RepID=B7KJW6_GLOC7|nr:ATP-binding protein [Gloeothece citriformis]ACK69565.1 response regulator receiver sensor signal transduction histidine kinase [Gloeothece citriformis PCC 7424]